MKRFLLAFIACALAAAPAGAPAQTPLGSLRAGGPANCPQAATYLAAVTLDATHQALMADLICGLPTAVAGGLDVLYVFATQNQAAALTNVVNPGTYNGTAYGSPTFTADNGFTGVDGSTTVYIDTGFNPTTATGPHYAADPAFLGVWSNTDATPVSGGAMLGAAADGACSSGSVMIPEYTDGHGHYAVNEPSLTDEGAAASSAGFFVAIYRGSILRMKTFYNSTVFGVTAPLQTGMPNASFSALACNGAGSISMGSPAQVAIVAIGGNVTNWSAMCHLFNVYLTAVNGAANVC